MAILLEQRPKASPTTSSAASTSSMTRPMDPTSLTQEGSKGLRSRISNWLRRNLFGSLANTILTLSVLILLGLTVPRFIDWAITHASIGGNSKSACSGDGACWTFIKVRLATFIYGHYPAGELWRVNVAAILLAILIIPVIRQHVKRRGLWLLGLVIGYPAVACVLLIGGTLGLPFVPTDLWGGLMLNVVMTFIALVGSFVLGTLLALGRRSTLPIVRLLSVGFIELWRAVPLLTILFMSAVMLPLFLPDGVSIDRLVRAIVALTLFTSAYMAEVVRGGLQSVPEGQEEAAYSLGLRWIDVQIFVLLPQAFRQALPAIINTAVELFKDTTLVTMIGVFDLLGAVTLASKDPNWIGYVKEGYVFAMFVFFVCCFSMSFYGRRVERRLNRDRSNAG